MRITESPKLLSRCKGERKCQPFLPSLAFSLLPLFLVTFLLSFPSFRHDTLNLAMGLPLPSFTHLVALGNFKIRRTYSKEKQRHVKNDEITNENHNFFIKKNPCTTTLYKQYYIKNLDCPMFMSQFSSNDCPRITYVTAPCSYWLLLFSV